MPMPLSVMVSVRAVLVHADPHFQVGRVLEQRRRVERLEAQLVAGVGRVGDQFAQKDLLVGIQRVGDQVQQLRHFGLEGKGLLCHGESEKSVRTQGPAEARQVRSNPQLWAITAACSSAWRH
jgi:hypothetical protein